MKSLLPRKQAYKREIQLLSRGFSAPQAWPDGKITVFPWDSDVDAFLMEKTRTGTGNLLYGILEKVCNLNGASVDQFVFTEINAILLLSRALQFDGLVEYESQCPHCRSKAPESIKIPDELAPVGMKSAEYPGYDTITLPDCKDVVRIRPLLVKDHKKIEERAQDALWAGYSDHHLELVLPVMSVNDGNVETLEEVYQWYMALSPADARYLEEQEMLHTPHLDTKIPHKCDKCAKTYFHILNFDQEFFRARGRGQHAPPLAKNVRAGVVE